MNIKTAPELRDTAPERQRIRMRRVCGWIAEARWKDAANALILAAREEAGGQWAVDAMKLAAHLLT